MRLRKYVQYPDYREWHDDVIAETNDDARRTLIAWAAQEGVWLGGDALHGPVDRGEGTIYVNGVTLEVSP